MTKPKSDETTERRDEGRLARRQFMKLAGATVASAMSGCWVYPRQEIVPYVGAPEEVVPGRPLHYATATLHGAYAMGVLVEAHEGRPSHIHGNELHPASRGATDPFMQASVLGLYDHDRGNSIVRGHAPANWRKLIETLRASLGGRDEVRLLTPVITSPSLYGQIQILEQKYPNFRWHQWEPVNSDPQTKAIRDTFGRDLHPRYHFERAQVVVGLESNFFYEGPDHIANANDAMKLRRVRWTTEDMSRIYVAETFPSVTGSAADHASAMTIAEIHQVLHWIAAETGVLGTFPEGLAPRIRKFATAAARDLLEHPGESLLLVGPRMDSDIQSLAHHVNAALDNFGKTIELTEPVVARRVLVLESLSELVDEAKNGKIDTLIVAGCNPVYASPADLEVGVALSMVPTTVHMALVPDETTELCEWYVPLVHEFEDWSDARAFDGTVSIVQPIIEPLWGGRSLHALLGELGDFPKPHAHEIVKSFWEGPGAKFIRDGASSEPFEQRWRRWLARGVVDGTKLEPVDAKPRGAPPIPPPPEHHEGLEVTIHPDPCVWGGEHSNNAWLQELPKPITKLAWGNAIFVGPDLAPDFRQGKHGQLAAVEVGGRRIVGPMWVEPTVPKNSIAIHLGYGREEISSVAGGHGFSAYDLQTIGSPWHRRGAKFLRIDGSELVACTQDHQRIDHEVAHHVLHHDTFEEFLHELGPPPPKKTYPNISLYDAYEYDDYQWAMVIDQTLCIGCNACVVACQSENNIPVVGKENVSIGREMHWLRIDQYRMGPEEHPEIFNQPMPCQHCERAPCEYVCPVHATTHSSEGINEMTYNRCVGTRYCSNNCPYKVRRFNFFEYNDDDPVLRLRRNPDVTVRDRGVMEKCTYCIQRINEARRDAKVTDDRIGPDQVETACQEACPTHAIIFGDRAVPGSRVSLLEMQPHNYVVLADANTRPRTSYLATIRNKNDKLKGGG